MTAKTDAQAQERKLAGRERKIAELEQQVAERDAQLAEREAQLAAVPVVAPVPLAPVPPGASLAHVISDEHPRLTVEQRRAIDEKIASLQVNVPGARA